MVVGSDGTQGRIHAEKPCRGKQRNHGVNWIAWGKHPGTSSGILYSVVLSTSSYIRITHISKHQTPEIASTIICVFPDEHWYMGQSRGHRRRHTKINRRSQKCDFDNGCAG